MNKKRAPTNPHHPAQRTKSPWWSHAAAALMAALIIAGLVSLGASMVTTERIPQSPEDKLEQMVEARMSSYLADATEHIEP